MILIKRKDGTVQVIPQGAVRMVEYLPSPGVLRIHFLGGEPSLDVRVTFTPKKLRVYVGLPDGARRVRREAVSQAAVVG